MTIEIVDFPLENGWIFHSSVSLPGRVPETNPSKWGGTTGATAIFLLKASAQWQEQLKVGGLPEETTRQGFQRNPTKIANGKTMEKPMLPILLI